MESVPFGGESRPRNCGSRGSGAFEYLRNELCSNNLRDFGLKKGLDHAGKHLFRGREVEKINELKREGVSVQATAN